MNFQVKSINLQLMTVWVGYCLLSVLFRQLQSISKKYNFTWFSENLVTLNNYRSCCTMFTFYLTCVSSFLIAFLCVCVCVHAQVKVQTRAVACVWRSEDDFGSMSSPSTSFGSLIVFVHHCISQGRWAMGREVLTQVLLYQFQKLHRETPHHFLQVHWILLLFKHISFSGPEKIQD